MWILLTFKDVAKGNWNIIAGQVKAAEEMKKDKINEQQNITLIKQLPQAS